MNYGEKDENEEMTFGSFVKEVAAITLFIALAGAGLSELNRGDEFKPCNEHEGVKCGN